MEFAVHLSGKDDLHVLPVVGLPRFGRPRSDCTLANCDIPRLAVLVVPPDPQQTGARCLAVAGRFIEVQLRKRPAADFRHLALEHRVAVEFDAAVAVDRLDFGLLSVFTFLGEREGFR